MSIEACRSIQTNKKFKNLKKTYFLKNSIKDTILDIKYRDILGGSATLRIEDLGGEVGRFLIDGSLMQNNFLQNLVFSS